MEPKSSSFGIFDPYDYAINVSKDFRVGTFSHPWEKTVCVFGEELLDLTKELQNQVRIKRKKTV